MTQHRLKNGRLKDITTTLKGTKQLVALIIPVSTVTIDFIHGLKTICGVLHQAKMFQINDAAFSKIQKGKIRIYGPDSR